MYRADAAWMMVGVGMLSKCAFPMLLFCFTSVMSSVSVMLQVAYFKATHGKRFFRMTPIHHHYQKKGIPEPKIVQRFAIIGILLAIVSIVTLKLR